jgi:hypothetical protein
MEPGCSISDESKKKSEHLLTRKFELLKLGLSFLEFAGADTGGAHFDRFDSTVFNDSDFLNVRFESAFVVFYDVRTDTAVFLR